MDALGTRMKERYESRSQTFLPRRTYTLIRVDGKAFHTFTRGFDRPYDQDVQDMMDEAAMRLCMYIQGAQFAYVQSDEISVLLTDFEKINTDAWFDGNIQKIVSISASIATCGFNQLLDEKYIKAVEAGDGSRVKYMSNEIMRLPMAQFDSRVFTIPDPVEVANYFIWRQQDATRNAINMVGQSLYSHRELHRKNTDEVQEMIFQKGKNFNDYPIGFKRGRVIRYDEMKWRIDEQIPIFTQDKAYLKFLIPTHPDFEWKKEQENVGDTKGSQVG